MNDRLKDFEYFVSAVETPPRTLSEKIYRRVGRDLDPTPVYVFAKLGIIHLLVSVITLSLCPQFGLRLFFNVELLSFLHKYGETVCTFACGIFFLGTTAAFALAFMSREQLRMARRTAWVQFSTLSLSSLGFFIALGADVVLSMAVIWFLGTLAGGVGIIKLSQT